MRMKAIAQGAIPKNRLLVLEGTNGDGSKAVIRLANAGENAHFISKQDIQGHKGHKGQKGQKGLQGQKGHKGQKVIKEIRVSQVSRRKRNGMI